MGQTVYVDLYFLINFSMDFLCFFLVARLLSFKLSFPRTLAASVLGGIYANLALFLPVSTLVALFIDMVACALMCAVALFRPPEARRLPLSILVYIAVSMVLGGAMTALFHLFNRLPLPLENGDSDGISVWIFALLAIAGGLITHLCGRFFSGRGSRKHVTVVMEYEHHTCTLTALCDTGNLLREPISGKPCIVVDCDRLRGLLPADLLTAAKHEETPSATLLSRYAGRIRLIPAHSATGARMLLAFRTDHLTVDSGRGPHEVDALVVLSPLASTADALIPPELLV